MYYGMRNCFLPINCFELHSYSLHLMPPKSRTESGQIVTEYILNLTCHFIIQYCTVLLQFFTISLHPCLSKEHSVICKLSHLAAVSWLGVMNSSSQHVSQGNSAHVTFALQKLPVYSLLCVCLQNTTYSFLCRPKF